MITTTLETMTRWALSHSGRSRPEVQKRGLPLNSVKRDSAIYNHSLHVKLQFYSQFDHWQP